MADVAHDARQMGQGQHACPCRLRSQNMHECIAWMSAPTLDGVSMGADMSFV